MSLAGGVSNLLPVASGGHGSAPSADDQVFVSVSTSAGAWQTLPNCPDSGGNHLNYTIATNQWSCGTSGGASGAPVGARYLVAEADATLTADVNLGALTTGLLKHTVSGGISTPATAVAGTDYLAPGGALGTPASGTLTNATGLPLATGVTGDLPYSNLTPATAASRLLGRDSTGAGDWQELTPATVKALLGVTFGDLTGTATDAQIPDLNTLTTGLTVSRCVETDGTGKLGVAAGACGVSGGSTGISGATNHGLMVATGGTTGTSLGIATNGQLPIGSAGADPVLAVPQGTANQIEVVPGAGSLVWRLPVAGVTLPGTTTANLGNATGLPLVAGTTGTLTAARGGTDVTTPTDDTVLIGSGTAWQLKVLPNCAAGNEVLRYTTATNVLSCGTVAGVTDGDKGDMTVTGTGTVWALDPDTVTYAKLQNTSVPSVLLGRGSAAGAGDPQEITLGTNLTMTGTTLNATGAAGVTDGDKGDVTVASAGTVWTIDPAAVTYAKIQNVSTTAQVLGRNTAGAGPIEELSVATVKTMLALGFGDLGGTATATQLPTAAADATTKGVATFAANDFECAAGLCTLDYTNGQAASATLKGFLTAADWNTFNNKQPALGFVAENSANKNTSATLGTSNSDYPSQGAVKLYVDSGVKALTNTAITPRPCVMSDTATITMNADNLTGCDFVQVAQLSQTTTFDLTSGTYVNGQFLSLLIFTTLQRGLVFTTGAGKFAAEGIPLPTFSRAGGYILYGFRYNALSNRWALVATNQETNYGTSGYVRTAGGPGVEPSWQAPAGGGIAGTIGTIHLPMSAVRFPSSNFAVFDGSETNGRLLFDGGTSECAYWGPFRMNADYTSTPVFKFQYSMTSATGALGVAIAVSVSTAPASSGVDINTKAYAAANTCTQTPVPAVLGDFKEIVCPLTTNDGLAAGRLTKIQLCRATGDGVDTASGSDMEGLTGSLEYTR